MQRVWETPCDSASQKLVLLALADNANDESVCWPSIATIARKCDLSARGVQTQIRKLENSRILNIETSTGRSSNLYILFPDQPCIPCMVAPSVNPARIAPQPCNPQPQPCTDCTPTLHAVHPNRKEPSEPSIEPPAVISPDILKSERFSKSWAEWEKHRREIKKKLSPTTAHKQLAMLAEWGEEKAVYEIERSIRNGWQGLFFEKVNGFNKPTIKPNHDEGF